jgi:hypothetical protein
MEVRPGSPTYQRLNKPTGTFSYSGSIATTEEFPVKVGDIDYMKSTDQNVLSYQWQITYRVTGITKLGEEEVVMEDGYKDTIAKYIVTCEIINAVAEQA